MKYAIFDLDNCISRDDWRVKYIDHDEPDNFLRYHKYQLLAGYDQEDNCEVVDQHRNAGDSIVFLTARPEHYRAITEEWLVRHFIPYSKVIMRPDGDHSHSTELKTKLLARHGFDKDNVSAIYDDRMDCIVAFKQLGLPAIQMAIANINYEK